MNRKNILIIIMSVLLTAVMILAVGCGEDVPNEDKTTVAPVTTVAPDTTVTADTTAADTTVADTTVADTTAAVETTTASVDTTVAPDTTTAAPDTTVTPGTTAAPDTTVTPGTTAAPDTTVTPGTTAAPDTTVTPGTTVAPSELTFAEFLAMSPADQQAYMESYSDMSAFLAWYAQAEAKYKAEQGTPVTGDGNINIGDYIG